MKFLTKINRNYLILLSGTLLIVTVSAYFVLSKILLQNTKSNLIEQELLIKKQLERNEKIPNLYPIIEVKQVSECKLQKHKISKILLRNVKEDEVEQYLEYSNIINVNNKFYSIKLRQSTFENEDLVSILTISLSVLLLLVLIITFFVSKKINKTVWVDFEENLQYIEQFSFSSPIPIKFLKSDIEEFDRLNKVVDNLTKKLKSDYYSLKEFSENASHEIQTPLSIALINLEEILQYDLDEEIFKKVLTSINALKRLSSLNQSLILLTKIENKQFKAEKAVLFNDLVNRKIEEFSSLFETKNIKVEVKITTNFYVKINEQLAELLVNNLLSNAIKHNHNNGEIHISIDENLLKICNSGDDNLLTDENIFKRFTKGNSKSFGLGLAIVKNICEANDLEISYIKIQNHCFTIQRKYFQ